VSPPRGGTKRSTGHRCTTRPGGPGPCTRCHRSRGAWACPRGVQRAERRQRARPSVMTRWVLSRMGSASTIPNVSVPPCKPGQGKRIALGPKTPALVAELLLLRVPPRAFPVAGHQAFVEVRSACWPKPGPAFQRSPSLLPGGGRFRLNAAASRPGSTPQVELPAVPVAITATGVRRLTPGLERAGACLREGLRTVCAAGLLGETPKPSPEQNRPAVLFAPRGDGPHACATAPGTSWPRDFAPGSLLPLAGTCAKDALPWHVFERGPPTPPGPGISNAKAGGARNPPRGEGLLAGRGHPDALRHGWMS